MIALTGADVGSPSSSPLLQQRSRQPPGTISVTVVGQTGAQPGIGRTSQNFTHPKTGRGPDLGQSISQAAGNLGAGRPSGQADSGGLITTGTTIGVGTEGAFACVGDATGTNVGVGITMLPNGDDVGNSVSS